MKIQRRPMNVLLPVPLVMVSVAGDGRRQPRHRHARLGRHGVLGAAHAEHLGAAVALLATVCCSGSHEFVVNVPRASQVREVDLCGNVSGRDTDKFAACGFHAVPARASARR